MNQMQDMVAIVTGASRGLGKAIALEFASEGAKVVICARATSPTGLACTLDETTHAIQDAGGEVLPLASDVTDDKEAGLRAPDAQRIKNTAKTCGKPHTT